MPAYYSDTQEDRFGPSYQQIDADPRRYKADGSRPPAWGQSGQWTASQREVTAGDLAELSKDVYSPPATRKDTFDKSGLNNKFVYNEKLSNDDVGVFDHPATGKEVVVFRGTRPTQGSDLVADYHIAAGSENKSKRFKRYDDTVDRVGKDNIEVFSGHSLGGAGADYESRRTGIQAVTFNEGSSPGFAGKNIWGKSSNKRVRQYTTGVDPISFSNWFTQRGKGITVLAPEGLDVHGADNFATGRNRKSLNKQKVIKAQ